MTTFIIAVFITLLSQHSNAAEPAKVQYGTVAPTMTKLDAAKALIRDPKVIIYKCSQVELNDKLSLVNVKSKK